MMEGIASAFSWPYFALSVTVYFLTLAFYRLFLHPLSRVPGPKLAAISRWYEAYWDVIHNGQYTFKIAELHKRYGPIIRISPYELHINDPDFFDQLYRQDGVWDKYDWAVNAFATYGALLFTTQHELHKARRQPLNAYFSKSRVSSRQSVINRHMDKLCDRISAFAESHRTFNLGAAITAAVRDVAFDFILDKNYRSLDKDDFDEPMVMASSGSGQVWRVSKHMRFIAPILRAVPIDWIIKYGNHGTKLFFRFLKECLEDTRKLVDSVKSSSPDQSNEASIVHEILKSKLPALEKTTDRIFDDVSTITGAGFETTAGALRVALFHVFDNPEILQRLRTELATVDSRDLKVLEQLPYLKAVLMEGLRISPALGTRMARIAPDRDLFYKHWRIPAGTPVGMTLVLLHADETVYPEPRIFNPDRWLSHDGEHKLDRAFAPFLRGTRACLGMHLAWAELYLLLSGLVDRFDFHYLNSRAEDFECNSDQFAIGTKGKGVLEATVSVRNS
ncbi:trichodiene oxygenase [Xylaria bambusicola]|uniref:trichodiene oxygenase n=1 Tax=Xylaria bambusicola TaxID=326684 RepID=UPI002007CE2F|nr:trichodiene oxygenase [Xylaria bambusicola]KAI0506709.1 trichodiene oxygenase [Xylaria bambusicola]